MALIHEKLYQAPDLANIDFADYAQSLVQMIARSYPLKANTIRTVVETDPVGMSVRLGVPVGLIINELLSNSFKYAFPSGSEGIIHVALRDKKEFGFELIVRDNGVGLPGDFRLEDARSLGLRLVKILADQIGATLEFKSGKGTEFRLTFREAKT
jgi:two-component sensor histidine kinase